MTRVLDPIKFAHLHWPDVKFYRQQQEIIYSVVDNDETYVPAGNALGKDFVAAFIALWWFCSRRPARVVTTSVKMDQLEDVLWGEIRRFIATSAVKLPLQYNHMKIRQLRDDGTIYPNSELVGQVSNTTEGLLGRHSTGGFKPVQNDIPRTLVIFDEASGINDTTYTSTQTWAHRKLIIGNPFPCENFFKRGVVSGDVPRASGSGFHRKVIRIAAADSPNVRLAQEEQAQGKQPSGKIIIPGVKSWATYQENLKLWDKVLQCVGLDAQFWLGPDTLLFPPDWLNHAERLARQLAGQPRKAFAVGIDPAEGGDKTAMAAVDDLGLIELVSKRTPDTSVIVGECLAFCHKHKVSADRVCIDRGGGGKEHADRLRAQGFAIRTVAFGESITPDPRRSTPPLADRLDTREERYAYFNRRAQMYHDLRLLLDPSGEKGGWAIPAQYGELRRQLAPIPLTYDGEGRVKLLSKNKRSPDGKEKTLSELIGCSPDEADAVVLGVHAMLHRETKRVARGIG